MLEIHKKNEMDNAAQFTEFLELKREFNVVNKEYENLKKQHGQL